MKKTTTLFTIACLLAAGPASAERNNSGGEGGGDGTHGRGGSSYSPAPDSWSARLDRIVNYGNHSSPNYGREAGGYAGGGSGTGGNY